MLTTTNELLAKIDQGQPFSKANTTRVYSLKEPIGRYSRIMNRKQKFQTKYNSITKAIDQLSAKSNRTAEEVEQLKELQTIKTLLDQRNISNVNEETWNTMPKATRLLIESFPTNDELKEAEARLAGIAAR